MSGSEYSLLSYGQFEKNDIFPTRPPTTVSSTIGFRLFLGYIPSAEGYIPKSLADI